MEPEKEEPVKEYKVSTMLTDHADHADDEDERDHEVEVPELEIQKPISPIPPPVSNIGRILRREQLFTEMCFCPHILKSLMS